MRVCDITKTDPVKSRIQVIDLGDPDATTAPEPRVVHDFEVGEAAAAAFESKRWGDLHRLTPVAERPKDEKRSEGAAKAAKTRAENRAAREAEAKDGDQS